MDICSHRLHVTLVSSKDYSLQEYIYDDVVRTYAHKDIYHFSIRSE